MSLVSRIIGSYNLILLEVREKGDCSVELCVADRKGKVSKRVTLGIGEEDQSAELGARPSVLYIYGNRVLKRRREDSSQVIERISKDRDNYLVSEYPDAVWFVRRDAVSRKTEEISESGCRFIDTRCGGAPDDETVATVIRELETGVTGLKKLAANLPAMTVLSGFVYDKLKLPALVFLLLILIGNTVISSGLAKRRNAAETELSRRKGNIERSYNTAGAIISVVRDFENKFEPGFSVAADLVGWSVTDGITLEDLSVVPMSEVPSTGKPLKLRNNGIDITGYSETAVGVSRFLARLTSSFPGSSVKLSAINFIPEKHMFRFEITIGL